MWCTECDARSPRGDYASWFAVSAAIMGFVGLGCAFLSPLALGLAVFDLVRIHYGKSPRGGAKIAGVAIALSITSIAIWVGVVVYLAIANPQLDPYADPYGY